MNTAVWLLDTACTVLEIIWFILLADVLLERRWKHTDRNKDIISIIALILTYVVLVRALNSIVLVSPYTAVIVMVVMIPFVMVIWNTDFLAAVSCIGLFFVVLYALAIPTIMVTGWIGGDDLIYQTTAETGMIRFWYLIIVAAINAIGNYILRRLISRIDLENKKGKALFISIVGIISLIFFMQQMLQSFNVQGSLIIYSIIITGAVVIFGVYYYLKTKRWAYEIEEMQKRNGQVEQKYQKINTDYEAHAKVYHDMKHHLRTIYDMAEKDDSQDVTKYINDLMSIESQQERYRWTGIDIIDSVFADERKKAAEKGVELFIDVPILPINMQLSNTDMCSLFANLLDNAIEAATERVELKIRLIHGMILISLKNDCKAEPVIKNGELVTTKEDKKAHGWGTKSIKDIVQRYDGSINYSYQNNCFTTEILLNI